MMLMKMGSMGLLDATLVKIFVRELSLYPIGATVELSTGETARVIASSREPQSPWVGAILSASGTRLVSPRILNLSSFQAFSIRRETAPYPEVFAGF